jgi:hypothetical protein
MHLIISEFTLIIKSKSGKEPQLMLSNHRNHAIVGRQTDPADKTWPSVIAQGSDSTKTAWDNNDRINESAGRTTHNEVHVDNSIVLVRIKEEIIYGVTAWKG